ncbi:MAG: response regulator [Chloroflexi bacterium]|nr:response regulator [Chloroflexota bacterium]
MAYDKILIIDDDLDAARLIRLRLEKAGYSVLEAANGIAGLTRFYTDHPDLVLLDVIMPNMDGWEVCRRIREVSNVPIIMLTARGDEVDKVRGLNLGADDYVSKPFGSQELLARVRSVLHRAQMPALQRTSWEDPDKTVRIELHKQEVYVKGKKMIVSPLEYLTIVNLVMQANSSVEDPSQHYTSSTDPLVEGDKKGQTS